MDLKEKLENAQKAQPASRHAYYQEIINEAERFIEKAKAARDADRYDRKHSGACKRASMDLTRALSEFRRP